jgi:hypothetical protein
MPPAEHVQWQIAVTIVIAMEEPSFLVPVQRIVSGINIKNDLLRRRLYASRKSVTNRLSMAFGSGAIL